MRAQWIQDLPIGRKLMVIMTLTVSISLVAACLSFVIADSLWFWRSTKEELGTLADVLAINSVSALTFEDARIAEETLGSLRATPDIVGGCLYVEGGGVIARYASGRARAGCPEVVAAAHPPRWKGGELEVLHPVELQGERVGAVYLRSDLRSFYVRVGSYLIGTLSVLGLAVAIALALLSRLKNLVTDPILRLASAIAEISRCQDYDTRVDRGSRDEIGLLIDGFNDMLVQIQLRDGELRKARGELEVRVQERTAQLRREIEVRGRAERAAAARAEELARSNEELERYAYVASHDLKEPLRAVSGFAQLLGRRYRGRLDATADEYIRHMIEGTARMQSLLQDLLAYARVGSGVPSFTAVSLDRVLDEALANLSAAVQESGASVTRGPLPEVWGEERQLVQLFQNLIANALKFRGDEKPQVRVEATRGARLWEIRVSDNGIGIDPEYRERIFEIFQRLHSRRSYEGTGVGLAVGKKIVQRHGGRIRVEEGPGGGSTFVVTLPDRGRSRWQESQPSSTC